MRKHKTTHEKHVEEFGELLIAHAVTARKIAPADVDRYRQMFKKDSIGTTRLLNGPVEEGGLMAGVAAIYNPFPEPEPNPYPREWVTDTQLDATEVGNVTILDGLESIA